MKMSDGRHVTFTDMASHAFETASERISWLVAAGAGVFSLTASQVTTALAITSGLLAVVLALLNIWLTWLKIRKISN